MLETWGASGSLRASLVGLIVGVGLVAGPVAPADAAPATAGEQRVATKLQKRVGSKALGRNTAGIVLDARTGRVIWARRSATGLMPASVTKLATAFAAIETLGPDYRVTTTVVQRTANTVYLVGAGDPLLTSRDTYRLAKVTARSLKSRGVTWAQVRVDDSLYPKPSNSRGWKRSYVPSDVSPVRALVVNGRQRRDTSIDAGKTFARALEKYGVEVRNVHRKRRPAGSVQVAEHVSPPISSWLSRMLLVSDNDIAENVLRQLAVGTGKRANWTNARAVRAAVLADHKIGGIRLYDGSGLSRANRMTAAGTARLLRAVYADPASDDMLGWLPVSGRTGTLKATYHRFTAKPASCAKGLIRAKTGTLGDAAALAGVARTSSGGRRIFVLLENGRPSNSRVKRAIDNLAATATGCY